MSTFGINLKNLRLKLGYSQQMFSDYLQVSRVYISDLERGKKLPHIHFLINIAEKFDVSIDWLLGRECKTLDASGISREALSALELIVRELR